MKTVLFAGCSFTDKCGFNEGNISKFHWPAIFVQSYNCTYNNIAIGGMSNNEIFHRVVEEVENKSYDLVVIMWSDISRRWEYIEDNNVDDFTNVTNAMICGFEHNNKLVSDYSKIHYTLFNNRYMKLKQWLLDIIALDAYLTSKNIKYVFIKGFENDLKHYKEAISISHIDDQLKKILDFHHRPDEYILNKLESIRTLISRVGKCNWLNYDSASFFDSSIDVADDMQHPGPRTNKILADALVAKICSTI